MSWISHVDGSHIAELRFVDDQPCLGAIAAYVVMNGSSSVSHHTSPGISMHRDPNAGETLGLSSVIRDTLLRERDKKCLKTRYRVPGWRGDRMTRWSKVDELSAVLQC